MQSHRLSIPAAAVAALVLLPFAGPAVAQGIGPQASPLTNVIPQPEALTIHAKITAINPQTRRITLTSANGNSVRVTAGKQVDLSQLKVGDTVNAKYYRAVAFVLSTPEQPVPENDIVQAVAQNGTTPGGDVVRVVRISATVVGIDLPEHSIDLVNPTGGGVRTVIVTDPGRIALLPKLKIGDTITAVVGQSLAVSVVPASTSFFSAKPAYDDEEQEEGRGQ
jgi:hypothetical protein